MVGSSCFKKAELIARGVLSIPEDFRLPYFMSCSSSGPDAGAYSIVIGFDGHRLKIPVLRKPGFVFSMIQDGSRYEILKDGEPYIDDVKIVPCQFHAPGQAFIDLNLGCVFDCAFCAAPKLKRRKNQMRIKNVLKKIIEAGKAEQISAIALTSGISRTTSDTIKEMVSVVRNLRNDLSLPIGVEPYIENRRQIEELYDAGANEIKLNIHSWNKEIFRKVCPQWDYDRTLKMIETACDIFGKGKVTSNIIFELGEKNEDIFKGIENLAAMGCAPTLRKLRVNEYNKQSLTEALGDIPVVGAKKILSLAKEHKEILRRHNLNPLNLNTMCHPCGCCDIVPFKDI